MEVKKSAKKKKRKGRGNSLIVWVGVQLRQTKLREEKAEKFPFVLHGFLSDYLKALIRQRDVGERRNTERVCSQGIHHYTTSSALLNKDSANPRSAIHCFHTSLSARFFFLYLRTHKNATFKDNL